MTQLGTTFDGLTHPEPGGCARPWWAGRAGRLRRRLGRIAGDLSRGGGVGLAGLAGRGLGFACRYPAHLRWMRVIGGPTTAQLLASYPRIAYRHSTTYLYGSAGWALRLSLLRTHYDFLNRALDAATFAEVIGPGGLALWEERAGEAGLGIRLVGPCTVSRHREGELGLHFVMAGTVLYRLAFSVVGTAEVAPGHGTARHALFVGQVQGGRDCRDRLREAARLCLDNAPRDLLMSALAGLAAAWDIDLVLGVEASQALSRGSCGFDHDAFWRQYGGTPTAAGHYALPLPFHDGAPQAASAAHRRRTRRKRLYKADLTDAVAGVIRALPRGRGEAAVARPVVPSSGAALPPAVRDPWLAAA